MKRMLALLGSGIVAGTVSAEDASWHAAVPLWKSLSVTGRVVEAGPAPSWLGPKPQEPFAKLGAPARPAPEGLPRPRELPENVSRPAAVTAAPLARPVLERSVEKPKAYGRESFASEPKVQKLKPVGLR